jgi:hypothetical protein
MREFEAGQDSERVSEELQDTRAKIANWETTLGADVEYTANNTVRDVAQMRMDNEQFACMTSHLQSTYNRGVDAYNRELRKIEHLGERVLQDGDPELETRLAQLCADAEPKFAVLEAQYKAICILRMELARQADNARWARLARVHGWSWVVEKQAAEARGKSSTPRSVS